MRLSLDHLPVEGYMPAGKWMVALRDNLNDAFAGAIFREGLTVIPVEGRLLKRLVTFMPVVGVLRVEGDPFAAGDVSRLQMPAPEPEPVVVAPAVVVGTPTTAAELLALDEKALRALCDEMGGADKRWGTKALRRYAAEELGIEGVS